MRKAPGLTPGCFYLVLGHRATGIAAGHPGPDDRPAPWAGLRLLNHGRLAFGRMSSGVGGCPAHCDTCSSILDSTRWIVVAPPPVWQPKLSPSTAAVPRLGGEATSPPVETRGVRGTRKPSGLSRAGQHVREGRNPNKIRMKSPAQTLSGKSYP